MINTFRKKISSLGLHYCVNVATNCAYLDFSSVLQYKFLVRSSEAVQKVQQMLVTARKLKRRKGK